MCRVTVTKKLDKNWTARGQSPARSPSRRSCRHCSLQQATASLLPKSLQLSPSEAGPARVKALDCEDYQILLGQSARHFPMSKTCCDSYSIYSCRATFCGKYFHSSWQLQKFCHWELRKPKLTASFAKGGGAQG